MQIFGLWQGEDALKGLQIVSREALNTYVHDRNSQNAEEKGTRVEYIYVMIPY